MEMNILLLIMNSHIVLSKEKKKQTDTESIIYYYSMEVISKISKNNSIVFKVRTRITAVGR